METKNKVVATFDWNYIEHDVFDILSNNHPEYDGDIDWDWVFSHLNRQANAPYHFFFDIEIVREHLESLIADAVGSKEDD
jgi:hypothetical protein